MNDSQVILYCSTRYKKLSATAILQQIIKTTVVLCSRLFDTASCIETQSMCPATHDGGYFTSSLQQHMGDIFFRISLTADGPQRTRLPVPRTATSPSWSRSQNKINNFVKKRPLPRLRTSDEVTMNTSSTRAKQADRGHVVMS